MDGPGKELPGGELGPLPLSPPVDAGPFVFLEIRPGPGDPALEVRCPGGEGVGVASPEIDDEGTQLTPTIGSDGQSLLSALLPKPAAEQKPGGSQDADSRAPPLGTQPTQGEA